MKEYKQISHEFLPVYDKDSKILILGSFPSVKSREMKFYYGHPQNRFWKVLSQVCCDKLPVTIEEKEAFLLKHHIAVWDVIDSCSILGSSDSSIKDVVVNDFEEILKNSCISAIYVNGNKAYELYCKYAEVKTGMKAVKLPSTSPANAAWNLEKLCHAWAQIADMIQE